MVRLLRASGADARAANPRSGQTPLHVAAANGQRDAAVLLLDAGAVLETRDRNGATPLESAIQYQQRATLGLLLDRGASFDVPGALRSAVMRGQIQLLRLLVDRISPAEANGLLSDAALKGYGEIVAFLIDNRADVVYGSRFIGESHRVLYFWHYVANRTLTALSNFFTNLNLTDMETCYKVFRREVLAELKLKSNRFGFEPEITAKIAKKRQPAWRVYETPISYSGRTYEEGKKIGLKDAFVALYCVIRFWLMD